MPIPKIVVFASGSAAGAVIDYLVTLTINHYAGVSPVLALAMAMTVSASAVFLFHEFITFSPSSSHIRSRRYLAFVILAVVIFAIRSGVLKLLLWFGMSVWLGLLFAIGGASVINFWVSKEKIFN